MEKAKCIALEGMIYSHIWKLRKNKNVRKNSAPGKIWSGKKFKKKILNIILYTLKVQILDSGG